jgi:hypothetical protein
MTETVLRALSMVSLAAALLCAPGCSGGAGIGESCTEVGSPDECVANAVCTDEPDGNVCAEICMEDRDCPSGYNCDSVPGSPDDTCHVAR